MIYQWLVKMFLICSRFREILIYGTTDRGQTENRNVVSANAGTTNLYCAAQIPGSSVAKARHLHGFRQRSNADMIFVSDTAQDGRFVRSISPSKIPARERTS